MRRTVAALAVVALATPLSAWLSLLIFPDFDNSLRSKILIFVFMSVVPVYAVLVALVRSRPLASVALVALGMFMRLTALFAISIWLRVQHPEELRTGLLTFLLATATYLFFEMIGVLAAGLHKRRS